MSTVTVHADDTAAGVLSRRGFLASGTGLGFAFAFSAGLSADDAQAAQGAKVVNAYVRIDTDGTVTIASPVPEMGQATNTAIPLIIAEELDADWSRVRVQDAPFEPAYDNPLFKTRTAIASLSTRTYWMPARTAGAQARRVLLEAAAAHWSVPVGELVARSGSVMHPASGRRLGYGEIAGFATVPATLPEIKPADLKPVSTFRLIGKDVPRWDVRAKSTGAMTYAIDVQVPGMVYAVTARAPVLGATIRRHNGDVVSRRAGVLAVIPVTHGLTVVAERIEVALRARAALEIEWNAAAGSAYDSEKALERFQADARDTSRAAITSHRIGDAPAAMATAKRVVSTEYTTDAVYQAQLEPLTAVASVTPAGVEIWAGVQWVSRARDESARIAGVAPDKVKVNMVQMGGAFGRRAQVDYVAEAVEVAKVVGKPVKLMATRADDLANCHGRPMTAHHIDVGLDADGRIQAWRHRVAADLVVPQLYGQARLDAQKGVDHIITFHIDVPYYRVGAYQAEHVYEQSGIRTGTYRGIGGGPNGFATESTIDDLARLAGRDPLAYRLDLCTQERAKRLLAKVGEMAAWSKARTGTALGVGFATLGTPAVGESMAATVVEVGLDRGTGRIKVSRVWCAVDVGLAVQPGNIVHQVRGSLAWGVSGALAERITYLNGAVRQSNFTDYELIRMADMPEMHIEVVNSGEIPLPVGELGLPTVMPAVSNAVLALTGTRLRHAPFTPDRVKQAFAA